MAPRPSIRNNVLGFIFIENILESFHGNMFPWREYIHTIRSYPQDVPMHQILLP
jgi:hypothetical protein